MVLNDSPRGAPGRAAAGKILRDSGVLDDGQAAARTYLVDENLIATGVQQSHARVAANAGKYGRDAFGRGGLLGQFEGRTVAGVRA
jgi:hypothetical protein